MNLKLQEHINLLSKYTNEVLHYMWDPIGVSGTPQARDEYDSYVSFICSRLNEGATSKEIAEVLYQIETESMGMSTPKESITKLKEIADLLLEWKDYLQEQDDYHTK